MPLPYDISRCLGNNCHVKALCQRFTDQNVGPNTYTMTAIAPSENCAFRLPQPDGQRIHNIDPRSY